MQVIDLCVCSSLSRYTEAEMAAEPLLGVANWLNCPPSALRMPSGTLSTPAPKYHAHSEHTAPIFISIVQDVVVNSFHCHIV